MLIKFTLKKHKKENVAVVIFIDHSDRQKKKKKSAHISQSPISAKYLCVRLFKTPIYVSSLLWFGLSKDLMSFIC